MHPRFPWPSSRTHGFSLPEIAIAIGILSVVFVSLFALLPVGLTGFRQSIDTSNETWITQGLSSMVQTTDWEEIWGPNATITKDIYYFDEEGRQTDTELTPSSDPRAKLARLYQAKLFVLPQSRPTGDDQLEMITVTGAPGDPATVRVLAVMANTTNPVAVKLFDELESPERIATLPPTSPLTIRTFSVSMSGCRIP